MCRYADMTDAANLERITAIVNRVLTECVGSYGFNGATVEVGYDHDGDEALFIEARFTYIDREIDPGAFYTLPGTVREALTAVGEHRFSYIRHHFDKRQRVAWNPT